jgi:putative ABC transport system permease protein
MLKLTHINKDYLIGDSVTHALADINLEFRNHEFVSILGQSGSGKTTLLNLIGGLDHYTSGDLFIQNQSTKEFKDSDWDAYRNATIGFVFQSYNLISHLSVLDNVEIALTLSGVGSSERKARAKKVLEEVGLADQIHKRPNQLSGGQMQRVAIARALVNNPKIVLADEPTGAIDSKTSVQIMELIKKISRDRLVIMVTHNEILANEYSDRIIHLFDGRVVSDSRPYVEQSLVAGPSKKNRKTSMSFGTALKSSFKNLWSKKTRTILTAVAGSIGIIGIALVLAISNGMTKYVDQMQSDTLSGFPLTINPSVSASSDMLNTPVQRISSVTGNLIGENEFPEEETLFAYDSASDYDPHENVITSDFLDYLDAMDPVLYNSISYSRELSMHVIAQTSSGGYRLVETATSQGIMGMLTGGGSFSEIPDSREFIESQYDLLGTQSRYPETYQEIVLVVDEQNRIDVDILANFGIGLEEEYSFDDWIGRSFTVVQNNDFYVQSGATFSEGTDYEAMVSSPDSVTITIVGILRVKETASSELLSTGIGYTTLLTEHMLETATVSDVVLAQIASPDVDVQTGMAFDDLTTYESVIGDIGGTTMPSGVQIYPVSFEAKETIKTYLDQYNEPLEDADKILYSDLAETISGTISTLIDTITLILSAFAAISLVVSSIMIGIITYVSVVERTKEIGILRSIGARKRDIGRVFNAETVLIGFTAGVIGILSTLLLTIPLNLIIAKMIGVPGFAILPVWSAVALIAVSVGLTFVAGLIPSGIAARRDPVVALRTE